jgi:hypothetical protein
MQTRTAQLAARNLQSRRQVVAALVEDGWGLLDSLIVHCVFDIFSNRLERLLWNPTAFFAARATIIFLYVSSMPRARR